MEYNAEDEPEVDINPWGNEEESNEIQDFMKQDEKVDSLAKRRREKMNQSKKDETIKNSSTDTNENNDEGVKEQEKEKEPEHEWERLTEVQKTEENNPVTTEEDKTVLQDQITEEKQKDTVNVFKGEVLEDVFFYFLFFFFSYIFIFILYILFYKNFIIMINFIIKYNIFYYH